MSILLPLRIEPGKPILRGFDFLWQQIREAGKSGRRFTLKEIDLAGNDKYPRSAKDYLKRLVAGGYAIEVGRKAPPRPGMAGQAIFQLVKRPTETPHLKRDGKPASQGDGQQRMWNAVRALKSFTRHELAVTASIEGAAIKPQTAATYIKRLDGAGYLAVVEKSYPGKATVWRLKPSMNTGPKAPAVLRTKIVFDPNRNAIMGKPMAEEVRL